MVTVTGELVRSQATSYLCPLRFHVSLTVLTNDSFVSVAHCVNAAMEHVHYCWTEKALVHFS